MPKYKHIDTRVIHSGEIDIDGAVVPPIFQTAMYVTDTDEEYHDIRYIRLNNSPNHKILHAKMAALENAEAALVASSGMAAISTTLLTFLDAGDHLIAQNCLYGGTYDLMTADFPAMGIEVDFVDGRDPASWKSKVRPNTRLLYMETISNPLIEVPELKAAADFARTHKIISMIDNTFASPVNFRPAEHGYDLSLHSCTKYMNGHTDLVAGSVIGRHDLVEKIRHKLNLLGGTLDPHACFLLRRGMMTLGLRVRQQSQSALQIARFLEEHPAIGHVNYPGLASSIDHKRAADVLDGFGGMLSFEMTGGRKAARQLFTKAAIPRIAPSLGGVETLFTLPAETSHRGVPREDREKIGITDGLVRMSVGIEATEDLIDDLQQALDKVL